MIHELWIVQHNVRAMSRRGQFSSSFAEWCMKQFYNLKPTDTYDMIYKLEVEQEYAMIQPESSIPL